MIRDKIKQFFENRNDVLLVFLFGSQAQNRSHAHSDVDIALLGPAPFVVDDLLDIKLKLGTHLGREVDVVDLAKSHGAILQEVICRGELLINRSCEAYACTLKRMWFEQEDDARFTQKTFQERLRICHR